MTDAVPSGSRYLPDWAREPRLQRRCHRDVTELTTYCHSAPTYDVDKAAIERPSSRSERSSQVD
jgi:hypothetical protein